jgi:hypothetical protein
LDVPISAGVVVVVLAAAAATAAVVEEPVLLPLPFAVLEDGVLLVPPLALLPLSLCFKSLNWVRNLVDEIERAREAVTFDFDDFKLLLLLRPLTVVIAGGC